MASRCRIWLVCRMDGSVFNKHAPRTILVQFKVSSKKTGTLDTDQAQAHYLKENRPTLTCPGSTDTPAAQPQRCTPKISTSQATASSPPRSNTTYLRSFTTMNLHNKSALIIALAGYAVCYKRWDQSKTTLQCSLHRHDSTQPQFSARSSAVTSSQELAHVCLRLPILDHNTQETQDDGAVPLQRCFIQARTCTAMPYTRQCRLQPRRSTAQKIPITDHPQHKKDIVQQHQPHGTHGTCP